MRLRSWFPKKQAIFRFVTGAKSSVDSSQGNLRSVCQNFSYEKMIPRHSAKRTAYRSRTRLGENMKRFFFENWRAKLMALIVATAVWYLIKKNVDVAPERWRVDRRTPSFGPER